MKNLNFFGVILLAIIIGGSLVVQGQHSGGLIGLSPPQPPIPFLLAGLLIAFALKHWLADRMIRFPYESAGKWRASGWLWPLLVHGAIHGVLTFVVVLAAASPVAAFLFGLADTAIHSAIDRLKVLATNRRPSDSRLIVFGDQALHAGTYLLMIVILLCLI